MPDWGACLAPRLQALTELSPSPPLVHMQLLLVYAFFPSVAHAYDAYRAEEQVFK